MTSNRLLITGTFAFSCIMALGACRDQPIHSQGNELSEHWAQKLEGETLREELVESAESFCTAYSKLKAPGLAAAPDRQRTLVLAHLAKATSTLRCVDTEWNCREPVTLYAALETAYQTGEPGHFIRIYSASPERETDGFSMFAIGPDGTKINVRYRRELESKNLEMIYCEFEPIQRLPWSQFVVEVNMREEIDLSGATRENGILWPDVPETSVSVAATDRRAGAGNYVSVLNAGVVNEGP